MITRRRRTGRVRGPPAGAGRGQVRGHPVEAGRGSGATDTPGGSGTTDTPVGAGRPTHPVGAGDRHSQRRDHPTRASTRATGAGRRRRLRRPARRVRQDRSADAAAAAHAGHRAGVVAAVARGRGPGGGGAGGRRRHLRGGDRRAARPGQGDRRGHPRDRRPGTAGGAVREAGVGVRRALARRGHGPPGRRRRAPGPPRTPARLRLAARRDLLERAARGRRIRRAADDPPERRLRRAVRAPGRGGADTAPRPLGGRPRPARPEAGSSSSEAVAPAHHERPPVHRDKPWLLAHHDKPWALVHHDKAWALVQHDKRWALATCRGHRPRSPPTGRTTARAAASPKTSPSIAHATPSWSLLDVV